jgi:hypothetical protein
MSSCLIKTEEPIIITVESSLASDDLIIYLTPTDIKYSPERTTYEYAVIQSIGIYELNQDKLRQWIEETYYSNDYLSNQYTACRLRAIDFIKDPNE